MRQIFFDTETTGLNPQGGDRLVEVGCVEMVNRRLTGNNLHFYFNPQRDMPEEAFRVHGLSVEFLADKPLFAAKADEVLDYLRGAEIIAHNARFDVSFLEAELARAGKPTLAATVHGVVDTLEMAREMFPGKSNSLDALCRRFEVDNTARQLHGALMDAELLAEVYIRMTRGQDMLVIDAGQGDEAQGSGRGAGAGSEAIDLRALPLVAVAVDDASAALHAQMLLELDKASGGQTVWRRLPGFEKPDAA